MSHPPAPSSLGQESRAEKTVRKVWGEEKGVERGKENPTGEGKSLLVLTEFPCVSYAEGEGPVPLMGTQQRFSPSSCPEGHLLCLPLRQKRLKSHPACSSKSLGGGEGGSQFYFQRVIWSCAQCQTLSDDVSLAGYLFALWILLVDTTPLHLSDAAARLGNFCNYCM